MDSFFNVFNQYNWNEVKERIYGKTAADVERVLHASLSPIGRGGGGRGPIDDFMTLISPVAASYLEPMAHISRRFTQQRFGKTMQMYAPLYLSNECNNICTYCGFSFENKVRRKTLTATEMMQEAAAIKAMGYEHVLLVTGEANHTVHVPYFKNALTLLRPHFANISMEVQPLDEEEYRELVAEGLYAVLVYQETYHQDDYKKHHPKGKKSNFQYRLETPDRLGRAGVYKIGLGVLIGLEDWRTDSFFTALHLQYLERTYWQTKYSISFPRLRPFSGGLQPKVEMTDRELVQLICAWRIFNQEVELSLSTRETSRFRDHVMQLGITSVSAGSKTNPGGYAVEPESLEQFEIADERSAAEMAKVIASIGYEPVWKDWDHVLSGVEG